MVVISQREGQKKVNKQISASYGDSLFYSVPDSLFPLLNMQKIKNTKLVLANQKNIKDNQQKQRSQVYIAKAKKKKKTS